MKTGVSTVLQATVMIIAIDVSLSRGIPCRAQYSKSYSGMCSNAHDCAGATLHGICGKARVCCIPDVNTGSPASVSHPTITREVFYNLTSNCTRTRALYPHFIKAMNDAGIKSKNEIAAFTAQVLYETSNMMLSEESASLKRSRSSLGNTKPGDDQRHKGRGFLPLRGRYLYKIVGNSLEEDFLDAPELVAMPSNAARVSAWLWKNGYKSADGSLSPSGALSRYANRTKYGFAMLSFQVAQSSDFLAMKIFPTWIRTIKAIDAACPKEMGNPKCIAAGRKGTCQLSQSCLGRKVSGVCHGPADMECCIECQNPADLLFVIDASGSVGQSNFISALNFVANLCQQFDVSNGAEGTRIGFVRYSGAPQIIFDFKAHQSTGSVVKAVKAIKYTKGGTRTDLALEIARAQLFGNNTSGVRPPSMGVSRVLVLLTDGKTNTGTESIIAPSEALRSDGVTIFSVGIGKGVKMAELQAIANDPDDDHVFLADSYNSIWKIQNSVQHASCHEPALLDSGKSVTLDVESRSKKFFRYRTSGLESISVLSIEPQQGHIEKHLSLRDKHPGADDPSSCITNKDKTDGVSEHVELHELANDTFCFKRPNGGIHVVRLWQRFKERKIACIKACSSNNLFLSVEGLSSLNKFRMSLSNLSATHINISELLLLYHPTVELEGNGTYDFENVTVEEVNVTYTFPLKGQVYAGSALAVAGTMATVAVSAAASAAGSSFEIKGSSKIKKKKKKKKKKKDDIRDSSLVNGTTSGSTSHGQGKTQNNSKPTQEKKKKKDADIREFPLVNGANSEGISEQRKTRKKSTPSEDKKKKKDVDTGSLSKVNGAQSGSTPGQGRAQDNSPPSPGETRTRKTSIITSMINSLKRRTSSSRDLLQTRKISTSVVISVDGCDAGECGLINEVFEEDTECNTNTGNLSRENNDQQQTTGEKLRNIKQNTEGNEERLSETIKEAAIVAGNIISPSRRVTFAKGPTGGQSGRDGRAFSSSTNSQGKTRLKGGDLGTNNSVKNSAQNGKRKTSTSDRRGQFTNAASGGKSGKTSHNKSSKSNDTNISTQRGKKATLTNRTSLRKTSTRESNASVSNAKASSNSVRKGQAEAVVNPNGNKMSTNTNNRGIAPKNASEGTAPSFIRGINNSSRNGKQAASRRDAWNNNNKYTSANSNGFLNNTNAESNMQHKSNRLQQGEHDRSVYNGGSEKQTKSTKSKDKKKEKKRFRLTKVKVLSLLLPCFTIFVPEDEVDEDDDQATRTNWKQRFEHDMHTTQAFCILLAQLIFLVGIQARGSVFGCALAAICMNYLYLVAMMWLLLEAYYLYAYAGKTEDETTQEYRKRKRLYYAAAWGIPLVVVIAMGANTNNFHKNPHCWVSLTSTTGILVSLPIVTIGLLQILLLILMIKAMATYRKTQNEEEKKSMKKEIIKTGLKNVLGIGLTVLLSWVMATVSVNVDNDFMQTIFSFLNALQGFAFFLFYVVLDPELRMFIITAYGTVMRIKESLVTPFSEHETMEIEKEKEKKKDKKKTSGRGNMDPEISLPMSGTNGVDTPKLLPPISHVSTVSEIRQPGQQDGKKSARKVPIVAKDYLPPVQSIKPLGSPNPSRRLTPIAAAKIPSTKQAKKSPSVQHKRQTNKSKQPLRI